MVSESVVGVRYSLGSAGVDGDGNASVVATPGRRTTYVATYAGDANHHSSSAEGRTVTVQPHLTATISRGYKTLGGYHYYHYRQSCPDRAVECPLFTITAYPNMSGRSVTGIVQQKVGTTWRTAMSWRGTFGKLSHATIKIRYANRAVIGHQFRMIAAYRGSTDWAAVSWGYWYFRMTT